MRLHISRSGPDAQGPLRIRATCRLSVSSAERNLIERYDVRNVLNESDHGTFQQLLAGELIDIDETTPYKANKQVDMVKSVCASVSTFVGDISAWADDHEDVETYIMIDPRDELGME